MTASANTGDLSYFSYQSNCTDSLLGPISHARSFNEWTVQPLDSKAVNCAPATAISRTDGSLPRHDTSVACISVPRHSYLNTFYTILNPRHHACPLGSATLDHSHTWSFRVTVIMESSNPLSSDWEESTRTILAIQASAPLCFLSMNASMPRLRPQSSPLIVMILGDL